MTFDNSMNADETNNEETLLSILLLHVCVCFLMSFSQWTYNVLFKMDSRAKSESYIFICTS